MPPTPSSSRPWGEGVLPFALLLAVAQAAPPIPTGVNGGVLGTAEQFKVEGPARVCFARGAVDIAAGEVSYLNYMGIHYAAVRIVGQDASYKISEGDSYVSPRGGTRVRDAGLEQRIGATTVRRFGHGAKTRYGIYDRPEYSPDRDRLVIWVDGLAGGAADLAVLRRIAVKLPEIAGCKRRFMYGWFFDDVPEHK
jgi:hypothetical protein